VGSASSDTSPEADLLEKVRRLSARATEIPYGDLEHLLRGEWKQLPVKGWAEIVTLASDQAARWLTLWLFSPAERPDRRAAEENKRWEAAYVAYSKALFEKVPAVRDDINKQHKLLVAQHAVSRRLAQHKGHFPPGILSQAAIWCGRIGLERLSSNLYARALYPKGSIGRAELK